MYPLPKGTLCPRGGVYTDDNGVERPRTLNEPHVVPILKERVRSGGRQVRCIAKTGCGSYHTAEHFKANTIVYNILKNIKEQGDSSTNTLVSQSSEPATNNLITSIAAPSPTTFSVPKGKRGRPPKPIEKDKHVISFEEIKENFIKQSNSIAQLYQDEVDSRTLTGKPKESITDSFKRTLWKKKYKHEFISYDWCPVCVTNIIHRDDYVAGHIFPEGYGGSNDVQNIMPICSECNSQMGDKHLYFFAWKRFTKILWPYDTFQKNSLGQNLPAPPTD